MQHYMPEMIFVDDAAEAYPKTREILARLPRVPVCRVRDKADALAALDGRDSPIDAGKQVLFLTTQRGRFFKKCPGTKGQICCNYYVVNFATNCHLDCSYCILQGYFENNPFITFFVNTDDMLAELEQVFSADPTRLFRVGTGEFTDSLAMDDLTEFSKIVVPFFATRRNATLELKTKSDIVENLLCLDHQGRTSVAWSVNTPRMIASEEPKTAPLDARLRAAARCQEAGYRIGFHFDPMFCYPDWEREYRQVVAQLFEAARPENISWISLGGFRFAPELKPIIRRRFPRSAILCGEFVPCHDGKMRYVKPIRLQMYRALLESIHQYGQRIPVYLCMDSPQVWRQVYGWTPHCDRDFSHLFDPRLTI